MWQSEMCHDFLGFKCWLLLKICANKYPVAVADINVALLATESRLCSRLTALRVLGLPFLASLCFHKCVKMVTNSYLQTKKVNLRKPIYSLNTLMTRVYWETNIAHR